MRLGALVATGIGMALVSVLSGAAFADRLSFYGTPGLIEMPTAGRLEPNEIALTTSYFGPNLRNTLTFQFLPRVQGSFRYAVIDDYNLTDNRFDRSFELVFSVLDETATRPAIAIGLRDFGGTGIYSSEYIVATKHISPRVTLTGGLGWGRLAGRGSFGSPLGWISSRFDRRPDKVSGGAGKFDPGGWFRGDVSPFGGVEWNVSDRLTAVLEYSPDLYTREVGRGVQTVASPFNFGASYRLNDNVELGAYYLYGTDIGVSLSYVFNPAQPRIPGGSDRALMALVPRASVAALSWGDQGGPMPENRDGTRVLEQQLAADGATLDGLVVRGSRASVRVENTRFGSGAQAAGRVARALANTLPPSIETFDVTFVANGVAISTVTLMRRDLEELEFALDNSWKSYTRAQITDAHDMGREGELAARYPIFTHRFTPYLEPSLFDPENPVRADFGAQLSAEFSPAPGLVFAGQMRQPVVGNIGDATRVSNSILPHVRSDTVRYAQDSDLELSYLTGEYFFRPGRNLFGRVTVGYLETMYGGLSGEVLWHPVDSRLALGAEVNYAVQRDFDMLLGFQDYDVVTGHVSAYYDLGRGFHGQVDVGRYLAGDWGATFTLDREFDNGFKIGGFFTLTDVSFDDFGEGSFDKGIRMEIPLSWFLGRPSRTVINQTIRPVYRDGGARLNVRNRLYGMTRDYRGQELAGSWGRFWR